MMAQITVETIEKLNIAEVLSSLKKEQDAERALEAQSRALGVTKQQLAKTLAAQAKAAETAAAVEARAAEKTALAEAKAAERAQKAAERAARGPSEWTLALQANSKAINEHRGALNQQAEALGKASSLLGALSPELAGLTSGLQKATGATAAVGTALNGAGASAALFEAAAAPVTAVLAAGAFAWKEYNEYVEAGEKALKEAREEAARVSDVMKRLAEDQLAAALDAKVLAGSLTQVEADAIKAGHAIGEQYGDALGKAVDKIDALKVKLQEIDAKFSGNTMGVDIKKLRAQRAQVVDALETARDEYDRLNAAINENTDTVQSNIVKSAEQAEAKKKGTQAIKDQAEALREQERIEAELDKTEQMARERKGKEDREAVEAEMRRKQEAHDQALALFKDEYEYQKQLRELREAADKRAAAERAKQLEAEYESYADLAGGVSDLFGALVDSNIDAAKKGNEAAQDAILKQFHAQQAAAAVEAAINTILAVSKASTVAPPPFNAIAMSAALATGVAQEVAIASQQPPSFDDGAQMPRGTGQRQVVDTAADDYRVYAKTTAGLMEQMVGLMTQQQGAPRRMGRRPIAGDVLSLNASNLIANQLPRTVRGNAR